jgi:hypothetical protein
MTATLNSLPRRWYSGIGHPPTGAASVPVAVVRGVDAVNQVSVGYVPTLMQDRPYLIGEDHRRGQVRRGRFDLRRQVRDRIVCHRRLPR